MPSRSQAETRDQKGAFRTAAIACGIGGLVVAADIWASTSMFGTWFPSAPLIDLAIVVYGTLVLLKLQRNLTIGSFIAVLLFLDGTICMIAKDAMTQSPVSFGDLLLLPELFGFYGVPALLAAGTAFAAFAGLFLLNLRLPRRGDLPLLLPLLLAAVVLVVRPLIPQAVAFGSAPRAQSLEPVVIGHWGSLLASIYVATGEYSEARRLGAAFNGSATPYPDFIASGLSAAQPRNVYVILVESLFNPLEIEGVRFDREPLAPPFDSWFRRGGAHAMSPVFGARSADAEFELLCGLPALTGDSGVLFARLKAEKIDCLPSKLGRLGWNAVSMVPVPATFYSAGDAYRRFGFARSIFSDRIDMSDRDGETISAQSLLEQQQDLIGRLLAEHRPFLSYVFLTSGHFPYSLNSTQRPKLISVTPAEPMVEAYVNAAYYNMLAVGRYIEAVRRRDPTALIVTLGDHPPVITPERETTAYPALAGRTHQVPLMIFDGERGEVPLTGWIPTYQLPEIILERLTDGRFCAENRCYRDEPTWIRPTSTGLTLIDAAQGRLGSCDNQTPPCAAAAHEVEFWKSRIYALIGLL